MDEVWLTLDDGTLIFARLYLPTPSFGRLPAVVVRHGYLANLGVHAGSLGSRSDTARRRLAIY